MQNEGHFELAAANASVENAGRRNKVNLFSCHPRTERDENYVEMWGVRVGVVVGTRCSVVCPEGFFNSLSYSSGLYNQMLLQIGVICLSASDGFEICV